MIDDFGITLLQMMENAGRNLAEVVVRTVLAGQPGGMRVLVAAGPGGNGGGGLVAARHLHNRGCEVSVVLAAEEERVTNAVRQQLRSLRASGISVKTVKTGDSTDHGAIDDADVIIDALLGYSLDGPPRGSAASLVRTINDSGVPVVANDIPSGIDSTTGIAYDPAIDAAATVTIALPKTGMRSDDARRLVGDLYLGDIAVPPGLYERSLGISVSPIFTEGQVVKIPATD